MLYSARLVAFHFISLRPALLILRRQPDTFGANHLAGIVRHRQATLAPRENQSRPSQYASGQKGVPLKNAEYEYLAAITHREKTGPDQMSSDATYYLSLASNAKQQRHWAAVELYYKLAWESLPEGRRESVLKSLLEARSNVATGQGKKGKVDVK